MNSQIWGLWDCQELLSVHLTRTDAHDARDEHLAVCRCFTDEHELISAAVEIRCISVLDDPAPVENQSRPGVPDKMRLRQATTEPFGDPTGEEAAVPITDEAEGPTPRGSLPIFEIPQRDGTSATLDFTTPGPFGDFAFTARIPDTGAVSERMYGAYHTDEAAIFVEILQHWARVAHPDDILAGLDRAEAVLRFLTGGLEPTTRSQNDFDDLLRRGIEVLATMDFAPVDHEHSDERGDVIVLAPRSTDLNWISRRDPSTTFAVPASHLWVFVTGMMWRTYDHDGLPLSRLSTAAYETALATFRQAIRSRGDVQLEPSAAAEAAIQGEKAMATPELVTELCDLLGTKLVAYLASAADTRTVRAWADSADDSAPPDEVIERLGIAYQAATLLSETDTASVIQAWFQGRNPLLDDIAPARVLRDGEVDVGGASVIAAARAFAGGTSEM